MKPGNNSNEPMISGAISLPLSNHRKEPMTFGGSDDDVDVCLNCTLPPERCKGGDLCYLRHKINKDRGESDE